MRVKISARQSVLAQHQAIQVGSALKLAHSNLEIEYLFRESLGDKNLSDPLWKMPERGVFTEDFYLDLQENRTDMVVHSWKDLPTEEKSDTEITATLPRADQRDVLLFKKSSFLRDQVQIFSSSPRRVLNLYSFLSWALPWPVENLQFASVRGNIPTRIQKLLQDPETDGLVLAKAALDRLLGDSGFSETCQFLKTALEQCEFMVLPLSENPNAAAQGALAIEVNRKNIRILELLQPINCVESFGNAHREREILQQYGGGCHLALGISVLQRPYGRIEIVKGRTPSGENLHKKSWIPAKALPAHLQPARLSFSSQRIPLISPSIDLPSENINAVFISKAEAWMPAAANCAVKWTAGIQTWKKMAELGIWIHGSAEGLGEIEEPRLKQLAQVALNWGRLTHENVLETFDKKTFASYSLQLSLISQELGSAECYSWKSASEFFLALQKFPELRDRKHVCGPGRTYEALFQELKSEQNLYVELSHEFITAV